MTNYWSSITNVIFHYEKKELNAKLFLLTYWAISTLLLLIIIYLCSQNNFITKKLWHIDFNFCWASCHGSFSSSSSKDLFTIFQNLLITYSIFQKKHLFQVSILDLAFSLLHQIYLFLLNVILLLPGSFLFLFIKVYSINIIHADPNKWTLYIVLSTIFSSWQGSWNADSNGFQRGLAQDVKGIQLLRDIFNIWICKQHFWEKK